MDRLSKQRQPVFFALLRREVRHSEQVKLLAKQISCLSITICPQNLNFNYYPADKTYRKKSVKKIFFVTVLQTINFVSGRIPFYYLYPNRMMLCHKYAVPSQNHGIQLL